MNEPTSCAAADHGHACRSIAAMLEPVPLCDHHRLQVALLVTPDVLAEAMRLLGSAQAPRTLPDDERDALVAGSRALDVRAYLNVGMHGPIVYFIENGDRVKIGFSTNLRSRIQAFALQEKNVLMILGGGLTLERALHSVFATDRIDATEWFVKSERMVAFIDSKLADLNEQRSRTAQRQQRKHIMTAPRIDGAGRRSPAGWAKLAAPLYQEYLDGHDGTAPSAPVLVRLLRDAHPDLLVPGSPRSERNIRSATEALLGQTGV